MNIMAASSKDYSNTTTNSLLDHPQNLHHHHQLEPQEHSQMAFLTPSSSTHSPNNNSINNDFMRKYGSGAYDLADYDQAFFFSSEVPPNAVNPSASSYAHDDHHQPQSSVASGMRPPTLNIFPSQPMHSRHPSSTSSTKVSTTTILSPTSNCSRGHQDCLTVDVISNPKSCAPQRLAESSKAIKREGNKKEPSSSSGDHHKTPDTKTLRRLAQNREAARKSRLRRKAYVQQLESSRVKLTQLEQELQKAKAQGVFLGGVGRLVGVDQGLPHVVGNISSDAAAFNMEYAKWLEDYRLRMGRLRDAVENHLSDNEIRFCVDNCITHFDDLIHLKSLIVKADVFHILSGMWKTPAERCFMWVGGFRPSELIKIIHGQIEPLTQQQYVGILDLENVMLEAEERLSQDLVKLNQSLSQAIVSENLEYPKHIANYMGQMAASMEKLSNLKLIVFQADNLRLETIYRVHELMTTRQAARSLMAIGEYFHRLQTLSALWITRDRHP